jgi:hypothetical protein
MARHGDMGFADAMSWILPTNFQIPEFIRGYICLIDTEVLQSMRGRDSVGSVRWAHGPSVTPEAIRRLVENALAE